MNLLVVFFETSQHFESCQMRGIQISLKFDVHGVGCIVPIYINKGGFLYAERVIEQQGNSADCSS